MGQVVFTTDARRHFEAIFSYLEEHFSQTAAGNFVQSVHLAVQKITRYPETYPVTASDPKIHFYRLDKSRRLFYEITEAEIRVLAIFDTRQDPVKSPY